MEAGKQKITAFIQSVFSMQQLQAETIASYFNEKEFNKNDFLLKEGQMCNEYYFLEEGFMRAYTYDVDGNDITITFCSPNQVVCEIFSFFKRVPSKEIYKRLPTVKHGF